MCFTGNYFLNRKKIAKEDIVCYKIGFVKNERFFPMYHEWYAYLKDYLQPKEILKRKWNFILSFDINKGYHSYKSYDSSKRCSSFSDDICQFIIPKGTAYYENEDEIVSETIKWVGEICPICNETVLIDGVCTKCTKELCSPPDVPIIL
jgi:hypothetical protein